jgi:hypothetical protein
MSILWLAKFFDQNIQHSTYLLIYSSIYLSVYPLIGLLNHLRFYSPENDFCFLCRIVVDKTFFIATGMK